MRLLAAVLTLAGCDRVFALDKLRDQMPSTDASTPDAATLCAHDAPFETMARVIGFDNATYREVDIWLSRDELRAILTIGGPQYSAYMRFASRPSTDAPFVLEALLATVNARSTTVDNAALTPDGLTMYYEAYHTGTTGADIERATRPAIDADFDTTTSDAELNAAGGIYDYSPSLDNSGDRIYWVSSRSMEYDVWSAEWNAGQWSNPRLVYAASMRYEHYLVPSDDNLALYFGSTTGPNAGYELRVVTRDSIDAAFGQPALIALPMTVTSATPAWLSTDRCRMYLAALGDIWLATRTP